MTAITHVYNYTVRCPHYKDPQNEVTWLNHVEFNQSCEIALNRITKWHALPATQNQVMEEFVLQKADKMDSYFSVQSDRLKDDGHVLVTFKILMDDCDSDTCVEEIMGHLIKDYRHRISKLK